MRPLLLAALLAAAPSVAEATRALAAPAPRAALELAAPDGVAWTAGESVEIGWRQVVEGALPGFEEWEVFLSVDGGRSWPVRLTPHLGRAIGRYRVTVPNLPSDDVRLLLRFGDERREIDVLDASRFRIRAGSWTGLPAAEGVFTRGEAARAGAAEVLRWEEGDRSGARVRTVESLARGGAFRAPPELLHGAPELALVTAPNSDSLLLRPAANRSPAPPGPLPASASEDSRVRPARDALALLCRRNT